MNNLILPFAFCSLLLLLAQICPAPSFFTKFFKNISLSGGLGYLGNLVYLSSNNLDISESNQLYCMIQTICYIILAIFSEDKQTTIIVETKNSNNKEEIRT